MVTFCFILSPLITNTRSSTRASRGARRIRITRITRKIRPGKENALAYVKCRSPRERSRSSQRSTFQPSNVPTFPRHPYALQHFRCRAVPFARHFAIMPRYLSRRLYVATLRFSAGIFSSACVGARYIVPSFLFPAVAATFRSVLSLPFCGGRPSGRLFSPSASTVGASEVSPAREGWETYPKRSEAP